MRKLFPLASLGCALILILGMIGGGIIVLVYGARPFIEKLTSKKTDPVAPPVMQPVGPVENNLPPETQNLLAARANTFRNCGW